MRQPVSASYVVDVIRRYPSQRLAILNLLRASRGHRFASRVLALLRASCAEAGGMPGRAVTDAATPGASHVR
ncbi:MAG: hypothetical protein ABIY55_12670 [Kofleriaceae bacterium]